MTINYDHRHSESDHIEFPVSPKEIRFFRKLKCRTEEGSEVAQEKWISSISQSSSNSSLRAYRLSNPYKGEADPPRSLEGRLLFAVPKKGRLQQATLDLLAGSDIQFRRETRLDIALVKNHPIALVFLPAADIPTFVGEGRVDLGITGRDQVAEHEAFVPATYDTGVEEVLNLGFGRCRLQVQVPEKGQLERPEELVGKNVVTSFVGLTEQYFAKLEGLEGHENGVTNGDAPVRNRLKTKIKFVGGSVEAACALGVADGIVDLVESGETMKAAGLKAIDTVIESTATLIKSKHPSNQKLVDMIASRISGVITAQKYILCQYNVTRSSLEKATKITPGKRAPTITALQDPKLVAVSSMVLKEAIASKMDELTACGATDILVLNIANSRTGLDPDENI